MQTYKLKTKYAEYNCFLSIGKYSNGRVAISLMDQESGMKIMTATVNLPDIDLNPGDAIIKDYSDNEGVLQFGIDNKLWEYNRQKVNSGFVQCHIVKLNSVFNPTL